jgi:DNA-binding MarR family transcriptional regulator
MAIHHIGVDLWRAARAWKDEYHARMVRAGHAWFGDARSTIAMHLDEDGLSQAELVLRVGTTKQAVQQLLDALEADGIVRRESLPEDGRKKRVVYTRKGLRAVHDGRRIKREMERELSARLGADRFARLVESLAVVADVFRP